MSRSNDLASLADEATGGISKAEVGLGNVDNTADSAKPVSTAQQTALDAKANKSGDTFTGNVAVAQGSSNNSNLKVETTGTGHAEVFLKTPNRQYNIGLLNNGSKFQLYDVNAGANRLEVDTSGNVGIGGASGGAKLDVNGSCALGDGADISGGHVAIKSDGNGTDGAFFIANSDGTALLKVLDNGNVGIGTSSLTGGNVKLDLVNTGSGVGTQIRLKNDHNTGFYIGQAGDTSGEVIVWNDANTDMQFRTNGNERLRIRANGEAEFTGDVILNEDKKLYLEGDSDDDLNAIWRKSSENAQLRTSRFAIADIIDSNNDDATSYYSVRHNGTSLAGSTELFRVQSNGNVGIGGTYNGFTPTLSVEGTNPAIGAYKDATNFVNTIVGSGKVTTIFDDSADYNIATASNRGGTGESVKFTVKSNGMTDHNGMRSYVRTFYQSLSSTVYYQFDIDNSVQYFYIKAMIGYYPGTAYTATYHVYAAFRSDSGIGVVNTLLNQSHSNSGSWSLSDNGVDQITVTKTGGNSTAMAKGFIEVKWRDAT